MWFLPIGIKKVPKVKCVIGEKVTVLYDEKNPKNGYIKNNDGILNV